MDMVYMFFDGVYWFWFFDRINRIYGIGCC